ncbi:unnamed protein product [Echinostoma caproni]|uniref:Uncharacterized protein n=1 Tax=Echinostoma caproni TaxID=27848 RepID=A0A3P8LAN8_9TREM|nr:unnamed protein product [Echinostoma caproni]
MELVPESTAFGDVFLPRLSGDRTNTDHDSVYLLVGHGQDTNLLFKATLNPARIITCRLETRPLVDCPVIPRIKAVNFSVEHSEFNWFVTKEFDMTHASPTSTLSDIA